MAVRKILMLKKEGKIWTFLLENDVIAEIHCSLPDSDQHRQPVTRRYLHRKSKKYRGEISEPLLSRSLREKNATTT